MKYADMHCDALTAPHAKVTGESLLLSPCTMQCFAFFYGGGEGFKAALKKFNLLTADARFLRVRRSSDLKRAISGGLIGCALTVENLDWGGYMPDLKSLKAAGVIMASLVWNEPNILARPAFCGGDKRGEGGLEPLGEYAVERLDGEGIIVDISHLSDGGALEILNGRKLPLVASHSAADGVFRHPRNLTDEVLKKIADCGGAAGVNFYPAFLGGDPLSCACAHIKHIINVAGEDTPAIGSDFDGCALPPELDSPDKMPKMLDIIEGTFGSRLAEKIAFGNFARVLKEVCG